MKEIIITKYGSPETLKIVEKSKPIPKNNEILIKNYFSGINFSEIMARMGLYPGAPKPPTTLGAEGCGIIEDLGKDVNNFNIGDKVIILSKHSAYSSHICTSKNLVIPLPHNFTFEEGAAFPITYLTAYMMICDLGNFKNNETILIHGAGGGVGTAAIQLAKNIGGKIIGTASLWKHEKLYEMGVNHCIDYNNVNIYNKIMEYSNGRGVDIIIDPIGGKNWKTSYRCLSEMGKLIIFGDQNFVQGKSFNLFYSLKEYFSMPKFHPIKLMSQNKSVMGYHLGRIFKSEFKIHSAIQNLNQLIKHNKISPIVDKIFNYKQVIDAHYYIQNKKNFGKVLLDFRDNH